MQRIRASALAVCVTCAGAALAAALTGCASRRLSSEPPPGVRLAGDWKLDSARSDDLGKAVQQLRGQAEKARRSMREREAGGSFGDTPGRRRGRGSTEPGGQESGEGESGAGPEGGGPAVGMGPMLRLSPVDELMANVPQGDYLRIGVSASAFTVTSGDSSNQYAPGQLSDISAQQGDAQQISGWKGASYLIDTKPQWGPEIIQTYALTQDDRLTMTLRLTGDDIKFTYTRIYDRTNRAAPLAPPTLN
jgi:hypothetical protein